MAAAVCSAMRTRRGPTSSGHTSRNNPCCISSAAATPSGAVENAACTASPTTLNRTPLWASMDLHTGKVAFYGGTHRCSVPLPQRRAPLDVGEEEGDGARGEDAHGPCLDVKTEVWARNC